MDEWGPGFCIPHHMERKDKEKMGRERKGRRKERIEKIKDLVKETTAFRTDLQAAYSSDS